MACQLSLVSVVQRSTLRSTSQWKVLTFTECVEMAFCPSHVDMQTCANTNKLFSNERSACNKWEHLIKLHLHYFWVQTRGTAKVTVVSGEALSSMLQSSNLLERLLHESCLLLLWSRKHRQCSCVSAQVTCSSQLKHQDSSATTQSTCGTDEGMGWLPMNWKTHCWGEVSWSKMHG